MLSAKEGSNHKFLQGKPNTNGWTLLENYVLSKGLWPAVYVIVIVIVGGIIIMDNRANQLTNWVQMVWTIKKIATSLAILGLGLALVWVAKEIYSKLGTKKNRNARS